MNLIGGPVPAYFHGVLEALPGPDGVRLTRMTEPQLRWAGTNPTWGLRARCPAGASLVMRTDSRWLDLELVLLEGCRKYIGVDVEIDGALTHAVRVEHAPERFRARLFEMPRRNPREVRVHLPHTFDLRLTEVSIEDEATVEVLPHRPLRLLCLGDSITQGMDAPSSFSPYPKQLGRLLNAEVLNQGIGGHVFDPCMLDAKIPFVPDVVTVAYGTNDWKRGYTPEQFRSIVREYLEKLQSMFPAARITVISPIWRAPGHEVATELDLLSRSQIILAEAARMRGVIAIDGLSLVPHQPSYYTDGIHPNDAGFLHYALNLYRLMRGRI